MHEIDPVNIAKPLLAKYHLCSECLGRQFALIDDRNDNSVFAAEILDKIYGEQIKNAEMDEIEIGNHDRNEAINIITSLANNADYEPAINWLKAHGKSENLVEKQDCFLCFGLFNDMDSIISEILALMTDYDFDTFLIGTSIDPRLQDREDEFRAKHNISTGEAFKKNLNRVIGLKLDAIWEQEVDFLRPDVNLIIELKPKNYKFRVQSAPFCVRGRYHKYKRGIPQTHWPHRSCRGKGCEECDFTGKQYPTSVEEIISPYILNASQGEKSVFHGAGREDIDAKCLGTGRPFVIEVKQPKKRKLDLKSIELQIKEEHGDEVDAINLRTVDRDEVQRVKSVGEKTRKTYRALVESEKPIDEKDFNENIPHLTEKLINSTILQRTPIRVVHRRADITRNKKVYSFNAEWIDSTHFIFNIEAMGGTYIKELISGDNNRTTPSITGFFNIPIVCTELDVMAIIDSEDPANEE